MNSVQIIEKFQCPGCTLGSDTKCGKFKLSDSCGVACASHSAGTFMMPQGRIALGLPKGFNRYGGSVPSSHGDEVGADKLSMHPMHLRFWPKKHSHKPSWDRFNVAVWALVQDGFLFVRTYCPRVNGTYIDVVEGGSLALVPDAIDVNKFFDEMD